MVFTLAERHQSASRLDARTPSVASSLHSIFIFLDVDECSEIEGYCRNGRCSNTIGSSICECLPGYELAAAGKECIGEEANVKTELVLVTYT